MPFVWPLLKTRHVIFILLFRRHFFDDNWNNRQTVGFLCLSGIKQTTFNSNNEKRFFIVLRVVGSDCKMASRCVILQTVFEFGQRNERSNRLLFLRRRPIYAGSVSRCDAMGAIINSRRRSLPLKRMDTPLLLRPAASTTTQQAFRWMAEAIVGQRGNRLRRFLALFNMSIYQSMLKKSLPRK